MRVFGILLAIMLAMPVLADTPLRQITVTGQGAIEVAPDMATITVGVTTEAKTAVDALEKNSTATTTVLDRLSILGIDPRELQTRNLSLSPRWTNRSSSVDGSPEISGFVATNTITVRVRDLPKLGEVLDAVVRDGANTFHGLSFGLQEPRPATDEARKQAVADAIAKATLYAQAAGVALGDVLSISEDRAASQPFGGMEMVRMASDVVPVAEGELMIGASVTMVFAIAD
jgi:uncharacterized protein YggE